MEEVFSEGRMLRMLGNSAAPEHLRKAISECLIGGGGVARELLDPLGRKVAVTLIGPWRTTARCSDIGPYLCGRRMLL